jgi:tRNA threonylcarbamoyladenosine biosynthesis protein TsaE
MIKATTTSVDDTRALAAEVAGLAAPGDLIVLAGDLGTGKTAFAQGLGKALGITETIVSPAFVLVRTYEGRLPLVHLDVYRLDHLQEVFDLGIAELIDSGGVTVIEWGDVVTPALPADFLEITLTRGEADDDRVVSLQPTGQAWTSRIGGLRRALERWATPA